MKRRKPIVIPGDADPCPRCGVPMQIREPDGIGDRQLHQRFFYTRWLQAVQDNVGHARAVQDGQCGVIASSLTEAATHLKQHRGSAMPAVRYFADVRKFLHASLKLFAYYFSIVERVGRYVPCNRS